MILISEKRPVLKSDWIIALLVKSEYSSPTFKSTSDNNNFSWVVFRPIKLISLITFENAYVEKSNKKIMSY